MTDALFLEQAQQLADDSPEFYCLQTYIVGLDGLEWAYDWSWDLMTLFPSLAQAETERAEFRTEDRTRIVKVKLVEIEVISVFEAETDQQKTQVEPGRLF